MKLNGFFSSSAFLRAPLTSQDVLQVIFFFFSFFSLLMNNNYIQTTTTVTNTENQRR